MVPGVKARSGLFVAAPRRPGGRRSLLLQVSNWPDGSAPGGRGRHGAPEWLRKPRSSLQSALALRQTGARLSMLSRRPTRHRIYVRKGTHLSLLLHCPLEQS